MRGDDEEPETRRTVVPDDSVRERIQAFVCLAGRNEVARVAKLRSWARSELMELRAEYCVAAALNRKGRAALRAWASLAAAPSGDRAVEIAAELGELLARTESLISSSKPHPTTSATGDKSPVESTARGISASTGAASAASTLFESPQSTLFGSESGADFVSLEDGYSSSIFASPADPPAVPT